MSVLEPASSVALRDLTVGDLPRILEIEQSCFSTPWQRSTFESLLHRADTDLIGADASGPFHHEQMSRLLIRRLNERFDGMLDLALADDLGPEDVELVAVHRADMVDADSVALLQHPVGGWWPTVWPTGEGAGHDPHVAHHVGAGRDRRADACSGDL